MKVPVQSLATTLSPTDYQQTPTESEALITSSGQTTSSADLTQLKKAVSNYSASGNFYSCTNTGDAYTLTPVSPFQGISGYKDGQLFRFRPSATNTTQSPTANVNTQGVKNITKADGSTQVEIGDIDSNQDIELRYDLANDVLVLPKLGVTSFLPRGYISGLETENDAGDTAHDIKFNIGTCRDAVDSLDISLGTALVKQLDAVWTAGTGVGGLSSAVSPAIANTTYHMFVISKPDGTVDAGFDTSLTAVNLLADATGYTKYRRVWSMDTDASSNWTLYKQNGDICSLVAVGGTFHAGTRAYSLLATPSPTGIKVKGYFSYAFTSGVTFIVASSDGDINDSNQLLSKTAVINMSEAGRFTQITDTSSQIYIGTTSGTVNSGFELWFLGWTDFRN